MLKPQILNSTEQPKYNHGFSEEEEYEIKQAYDKLQQKVATGEKLTLDEQIIVFKHFRISRTEAFVLQDKIEKSKPKKERKEKEPKIKKMSEKARKARINELTVKLWMEDLTEEEKTELKSLEEDKK